MIIVTVTIVQVVTLPATEVAHATCCRRCSRYLLPTLPTLPAADGGHQLRINVVLVRGVH